MEKTPAKSPFNREVRNVFIPVKDIDRARKWYRDVLQLPTEEVVMGHLCHIPMDGRTGILLDQQLTPDNKGKATSIQTGEYPLFMFSTSDIHASLEILRERGVEIVEYGGSAIQNGHWFNFRDSEGNLLMVCA